MESEKAVSDNNSDGGYFALPPDEEAASEEDYEGFEKQEFGSAESEEDYGFLVQSDGDEVDESALQS